VACLCSLLLGVDGWMEGNGSCGCYHWLTTSAAITVKAAACFTAQESRGGRLQTTRDTPEGVQKPSVNENKLPSPFNRKSHVTDQDFTEFNINANHFSYLTENLRKYLMENVVCFADRYRSVDRRLRTTGFNLGIFIDEQGPQVWTVFGRKPQTMKGCKPLFILNDLESAPV